MSSTDINRTIERAKQELQQMIDLNPQVMLMIDRNRNIVRTNRAFLSLANAADFRDVLGKRLDDVCRCKDPLFFDRLFSHRGYACLEEEVVLPGEQKRLIEFTVVGSGENGELSVLIAEDVTSHYEHAADIEKRHKKEAVRALMGALMHNINQPLTVIVIRARLMKLALDKGSVGHNELTSTLGDIVDLAMQASEILKQMQSPRDYVTERYIEGVDILDVARSGDKSNVMDPASEALLEALMASADVHEPGVRQHAERTGEFSAFLARKMNLDDSRITLIRHCAHLHDIGKIGIPERILQKTAPLTVEERETINLHTEIGYGILCSFPMLREEAEVARTHHECYDGTGYPLGLAGEAIPLSARIVSVSDSFDAMLSERSYRPAMPLKDVVARIESGAGTRFDPEIVRVFHEWYGDMNAMFPRDGTVPRA